MSKEDLIRNFVSVEFNRFLDYYKDELSYQRAFTVNQMRYLELRSGEYDV